MILDDRSPAWFEPLKGGEGRRSGSSTFPGFGYERIGASPLVSVIITNYNYEGFLWEAVNGALAQTYPRVEVVVVDDGSVDDSRNVIASFGDLVVSVLKENGGQASATNAGFLACKGEVVFFLDADDVLLPDTVERVVAAFRSKPGIAKVHYRQRIIDASGRPTGELEPPANSPMRAGDMRPNLVEYDGYRWPSTSGNAYTAEVLHRIMPIPEILYRGSPDVYLCNLSAVFGEVAALEEPGTLYRMHGANNYLSSAGAPKPDQLKKLLLAMDDNYIRRKHLFNTLYSVDTRNIGRRSFFFLCARVISLRLNPHDHPFKEDTPWRLFAQGCILSVTHPDPAIHRHTRLLHMLWFTAMLLAPRPLARSLADVYFLPSKRGRLYARLDPLLRKPTRAGIR